MGPFNRRKVVLPQFAGATRRGRAPGPEKVPALPVWAPGGGDQDLFGAFRKLRHYREALKIPVRTLDLGPLGGAGWRAFPNTSCIVLPGIARETQGMAFVLAGVAVSGDSASRRQSEAIARARGDGLLRRRGGRRDSREPRLGNAARRHRALPRSVERDGRAPKGGVKRAARVAIAAPAG